MRTKISLIALLGLFIIGATSCKKNDPEPTKGVTIDKTQLTLKPGEEAVLTATANGVEGTFEWSVDPAEGVVTLDPSGAGSSKCGVKAGESEGTATITVKVGEFSATCAVTVKKEDIKTPDVAGEAGKYTIAFRAPETACINDITICLFGDFQGNDPKDDNAPKATKIEQAGFDNWYKIVFEAEDATTAKGKICPIAIDGTRDWNWQGSSYTLVKGDGKITDDFGTQNKIDLSEVAPGNVIFVDVVSWASDPCVAPFPGGTASFKVTVTTAFPEGFDPSDIQIAVAHWDAGQDVLNYNPIESQPGALVFEGSVPEWTAGQQYKLNISYKEGDWIWEKGGNRDLPFNGNAVVEVAEWESEPWNPIPGGEGTFTITFSESCNMAQYEKVIFTGSFAEEAWGESQREMTKVADNVYSWTGEFPENFMYKVIGRTEGAEDAWIGPGDNWKFDGSTYEQTWNCE